jgi:hypothetical protein
VLHSPFLFSFLLLTQAFQVIPIAGSSAGECFPDGIGSQASFGDIQTMWGDGAYLYVSEGTALRRIDLATREVTTVTRFATAYYPPGAGVSGYRALWGDGTYTYVSGVRGLWGDGAYIYISDIVGGQVNRVDLRTGTTQVFSKTDYASPWGLWGDGTYLYMARSGAGTINRVSLSTGSTEQFTRPPEPRDPPQRPCCSSFLGAWAPTPREIWGDGTNLFATGYTEFIRKIDLTTREVTYLPPLPSIPGYMTGSGRSLIVQDGPNRILKIDTVTGTIALLAEKNDPSKSYGPMWSDGRYLYARFGTRIDRINLETGESEVFAGTNLDDYVDATGEEARFRLPSGIWGDDVSLYVADYGNQAIRSIDLGSGAVTTFANLSGTPRGIWSDGTHVFVTDPT